MSEILGDTYCCQAFRNWPLLSKFAMKRLVV